MQQNKTFFPKVKDIAHMGVVSTSCDSTIFEAIRLMVETNLSDVIFKNQDGHGIFTVEDLMFFRNSKRDFNLLLKDISVSQLEYVDGEENVLNLMSRFDQNTGRYLGVRDHEKNLIGVISMTDVMASVDPVLMMERKKLSDILSKRQIETVDVLTRTESVLSKLVNADDAVLVTDNNRLLGIVTTKDAIRLMTDKVDITATILKYMTTPVSTIHRDETVKTAIEYLKEKKFKRAVVVNDDGHIDGIVTQRELINITYGRWAELMKLHAHELGELVHVLESENKKLKTESLTDPLTGIGNRRRFNQNIESEIGRYYRQGMSPFSILMLDIDFFKKINDAHGHLVGDQILKQLSKLISDMLRVSDEINRWGRRRICSDITYRKFTKRISIS
jgi:CBS domain-containing protein